MAYSRTKGKHLSIQDRNDILSFLQRNMKLIEIAHYLQCDPRTIAKEVKNHRILKLTSDPNKCIHRMTCHTIGLCGFCTTYECRRCKRKQNCNELCKRFELIPSCKRLYKFPFTCNGCNKRNSCRLNKYEYNSIVANQSYRTTLIESRNHIHLTDEEIEKIDLIVSPLIKNNISPEIILHEHPELGISLTTLYKLIDSNKLSIKNIDLKRKIRRRVRKSKKDKSTKFEPICKTNRYYDDFLECISLYPNLDVWEMDTVEGKKGGKALMTLLQRKTNFMLVFLINSICKEEVSLVFKKIKKRLGDLLFSQTFPIILTDNGREFFDISGIENSYITNERLIRLFFCEPRQSQQKGKIEKNHEHIREIIPKGKEMDFLTEDDVNLISLHINNYLRPSLDFASPFDKARLMLSPKVLSLNKLFKLELRKIILKPSLLIKK